eukprot:jgi/Botrbrau1/20073/Bobra.200_1s0077.1
MAEQGQGTKREGDEDSENGLQHKKARHDGLDDIQEILRNTKLADLERKRQKIVALEHNSTIGQALKLNGFECFAAAVLQASWRCEYVGLVVQDLAKHKILSAPIVVAPGLEDVLDTPSQEVANEALVGWLDIKDVLDSLLRFLGESTRGKLDLPMLALMQLLDKEGSQFLDKMVITVAGGGDRQLVYKANDSASILDTIQNQFLLPPDEEGKQQVVHRLAIFDAEGSILAIISQLDIMKCDRPPPLFGKQTFRAAQISRAISASQMHCVFAHTVKRQLESQGVSMLVKGIELFSTALHRFLLDHAEEMGGHSQQVPTSAGHPGGQAASHRGGPPSTNAASLQASIQPDHLSVLALPVAEFLALTHHTTYIGYSAANPAVGRPPLLCQQRPRGLAHKPPFTLTDADDVRPRGLVLKTPHSLSSMPVNSSFSALVSHDAENSIPVLGKRVCIVSVQKPHNIFSVSALLKLMVDNKIHRVYVAGGWRGLLLPTAVVTCTDVMRVVSGVW